MRPRSSIGPRAGGFTMIEVLVALLVFSLGILAMVSIQATAARMATDARDRAIATFLADQLLARMLISDPATAGSFAHKATGDLACAPGGAASVNPVVTAWLAEVAQQLPNASAAQQQIVVGAAGQVTVRLCWQNGNDPPHSMAVNNQVQWPL